MSGTTTSTNPLVKEVLLNASPEQIWQLLTTKEGLAKWSFEMDDFKPEPGFSFQFYGEKDGIKFLHLCKVLEVEDKKHIKWLWTYENVPGETFVTYDLFSQGDQTLLRLTHEGLETLPQDDNYRKENFLEGWNYLLEKSLPQQI